MSSSSSFMIFFILAIAASQCDGSSRFLSAESASVAQRAFRDGIMDAMGSVLGCGGAADPEHVDAVKAVVMPMWRTISKTNDRIDRRSLRYLVHRYFMQTSSLMIRGFEPTRPTNASHWGAADILSQMVPAYVESALETQHSSQSGFTFQDVVDMVLTLDQLIFDAEGGLLQDIYAGQKQSLDSSLNKQDLEPILEEYVVKWMVDAEPEELDMLINNKSLAATVMPHYWELLKFAEGRIQAFEYSRQLKRGKSSGKDAFSQKYSFEDAHQIIGGITRSFQAYWQSECASMKSSLIDMDKYGTGRVPLAKFYNTAINSDWRFGESESYLRELGALDESSSWIGPQVIIPNYLQATSNCIVSTDHYLVCCEAECESLMGEIERAIQTPTASPDTILGIVRNMTSQTTLDHDEPAHLDASLIRQLESIAEEHGGKVPLHGRLFAKWLHYVFPHECPLPFKNGATSAATPAEFGGNFVASKDDMEKHASNATALELSVSKEDLQWMSQWSLDEELEVESAASSWQSYALLLIGGLVLAAGGAQKGIFGTAKSGTSFGSHATSTHAHWV